MTTFTQERAFAAGVGNGVADLAQMSPGVAEQGETSSRRFGKRVDERRNVLWSASDHSGEKRFRHRECAAGEVVRALHDGLTFGVTPHGSDGMVNEA